MAIPSPDNANRLALGLMAAKDLDYYEAINLLESLSLRLLGNEKLKTSLPLQTALVTAVNCAKRAFHGGVEVILPDNIPLLFPWPEAETLNQVIAELGTTILPSTSSPTQTIFVGHSPKQAPPHSISIHASGWRGGIENVAKPTSFESCDGSTNSPLGGIFAGGLAVHRSFLRVTSLSVFACEDSFGFSLWQPNSDWQKISSEGPVLNALPKSLWILGLGHLGQAYLWSLSFLPFKDPGDCEFMLQDFDSLNESNVGSSLLCRPADQDTKKARTCALWLEQRGFSTTITERPFGKNTNRREDEPAIALCGFDKAEPRSLLEEANFKRIIECGLGGSIADFDLIHLHTFPGPKSARDLWKSADQTSQTNPKLVSALSNPNEVCGALAIETAGKSVSTSFVGAMASSLAVAEILKEFHRGPQFSEIFFSPRNSDDSSFQSANSNLSASELASWGFLPCRT